MNEKKNTLLYIAILLLCVCLTGSIAYKAGNTSSASALAEANERYDEATQKAKQLQELNRESIANLKIEGDTVYVIGHRNPDADTVITAITYARLLNQLGYPAKPAITMEVDKQTAYILEQAGVETPEILYDASGLDIFLVDHSEYAQAADGMEDAHIVGILDHHGVGTVSTGNTLIYEAKPIGATATIVWLDYLNYGLEIDQQTAYLLLTAILSDTSNFIASTTTETDRQAAAILAAEAGVEDIDGLYATMHEISLSYEGMSEEEILFNDYKEYEASGVSFGIGLLNAIDDETAVQLAVRMKKALEEYASTKDVDLIYASIGMRENGMKHDYIVPGNERSESVLKNAFPDFEYDGTSYLYSSGLGRKTVFVPGLTDYLAEHPHE